VRGLDETRGQEWTHDHTEAFIHIASELACLRLGLHKTQSPLQHSDLDYLLAYRATPPRLVCHVLDPSLFLRMPGVLRPGKPFTRLLSAIHSLKAISPTYNNCSLPERNSSPTAHPL
jgi:hypothetical protein